MSLLLTLSPRNKHHAMVALANLSKFQGRYQEFLELKRRYAIKWTNGNESLLALQRFFNPELSFDVMLSRIREMLRLLPTFMGKIIKFACLIGLRALEVIESVRLLNNKREMFNRYYNPERQALEHFRFPSIFLRQTKKAYISFVTPEIIKNITSKEIDRIPSYNAIRLTCKRRGINMDMRYCRKLFASHLRQSGIQPEVIDLLQGRVSQSVLTRHYLVPHEGLKDQVLDALKGLQKQL